MTTVPIIAVNRPGDPGWIAPGSEQHSAMISPSKVAAILGFSRWESPYSLWCRMKGLVEPDEPKDIFDLGHDMEPYIAKRWCRLNPGWRLSPDEVQFVVDPEHFGFPVVATPDRRAVRGRARRSVQFKIARDLADQEKFGDDLTGDAPPDYTSQVTAEMIFTGFTRHDGHLMVAGPFWTERIYPIVYDPDVAAWMVGEIRTFWESLKADTPPPLDDSVATYETVRKLHPDIDPGTEIQLDAETAVEFLEAHAGEAAAKARLVGAKSRVLASMERTETALVGTKKVAKRSPHASGSVSLTKTRRITAADIQLQGAIAS